jgi:transposase InsO family protein
VETAWLRTLYVLFAIEVASRRVLVLGVTRNPDSAWVTQQARNLALGERFGSLRFLIRDRDSRFTGPFDEVFRSEGVKLIETPVRAPRANAFAEGWVRMVRTECLDWMPIFGRRRLERILRTYSSHYNAQMPHRGLDLEAEGHRNSDHVRDLPIYESVVVRTTQAAGARACPRPPSTPGP